MDSECARVCRGGVGDDGIVASAAPESAESGPETRVAGPEKRKSVVNVSPKASDVNNEGLFEGLIKPSFSGAGVHIFRPGGALNTGDNSSAVLANGACAGNVFRAHVGATTLGANAALSATPTFVGNILDAAGITIGRRHPA